MARAAGVASVIAVEPLAHRRAAAAKCGADLVLTPEEAKQHRGEVDVAFEVAGTDDAVLTSMTLVRAGGRVVLAGIPDEDKTSFPAALARRKGLTIAMVRRMKDVYPRAIDLVARGVVELDWLVSAPLPAGRGGRRFCRGRPPRRPENHDRGRLLPCPL